MIRFHVTGTALDARYQTNILTAAGRYDHRHVAAGERVTILLERPSEADARIAGQYDYHLGDIIVRPAKMAHEVSTTEALTTDPTTPEGADHWQQRHNHEAGLEQTAKEWEQLVGESPNGSTADGYPSWYVLPGEPGWPVDLSAADSIADYRRAHHQDVQPPDMEIDL